MKRKNSVLVVRPGRYFKIDLNLKTILQNLETKIKINCKDNIFFFYKNNPK